MAKLVLVHKADSVYEDDPDRVYDFPKQYLKTVESGVGDWAVYYEPVKAGPRGAISPWRRSRRSSRSRGPRAGSSR
jgi:hypothetical protein